MRDRGFSSFFLSSPGGPPLRIGILLDGTIDRATAAILGDLTAADFLAIVVVLVDAGRGGRSATDTTRSPGPASAGRRRRVIGATGGWRHLAWDLYAALDRRRVILADDPAAPVDRATALGALDARLVEPVAEPAGRGRRLPPAVIEQLREARLDVLLQLGMHDVGDLGHLAVHGSWALRNGDGERYAGDPPCAWEMIDGSPVTTVALVRGAAPSAEPLVLATARFAVDPSSIVRNRVAPGYGSSFLVARGLWQLHQLGPQAVLEGASPAGRLKDEAGGRVRRRTVPWSPGSRRGCSARRGDAWPAG